MKNMITALFVTAFLLTGAARGSDEMAFVDLQEVFKQFYKTQLAQDQIRQQADDIKLEREEIEGEVAEMKTEIEVLRADSRDKSLSEDIRDNKRSQLEERLVDLQKKESDMAEFEKLRMKQIEQQNTRMTKKLFDEIHEVITYHAKAKGYAAVTDRSAQSRIGTDIILYTSAEVDITANVLAILNEGRIGAQVASPEQEQAGE